jgi:putative restriction endonuclease
MNIFVANTDYDWYRWLVSQPDVDEVNFWRPLGNTNFSYLSEGELFFFKLKKAHAGKIVGFGQFLMYQPMSVIDAWDTFGTKNGVSTRAQMLERIGTYTLRNNSTLIRHQYFLFLRRVFVPSFLTPPPTSDFH